MTLDVPDPTTEPSQTSPAAPKEPGRSTKRWGLAVLGLAGLGVILALSRAGRGAKAPDPVARAVPVSVAVVKRGDMDLSLAGLGTVTPLNSVVVRSRVDGQLVRFAIQEGQSVQQGALIAEIDPRPFQVQLMQAEGQRAKDEAAFKNASADLARFKSLLDQGILSRQQYDAQTSAVTQYEAALKADQAQVESAKLNLAYSHITAPIAGKVGLRLVDPGNMVRASDTGGLCVINPVQPITVVFTIPADSVSQVAAGGGKRLPVDAYDRDMKSKLASGSVLAIDNQVDPATGTVRIKALFDNRDGSLFPNQFVQARLVVDTLKGVPIVPTAALQRSPQGVFVYRVRPDRTVEMAAVEVQASDGESTAIQKGLAVGDRVVTEGMERLRPGSLVVEGKAGGRP